MTYELRTYTVAEGRMDDLLQRFREHTVALLERHGMESIGYWVTVSEPQSLVYLLRHHGRPEENWDQFRTDPAWIRAKAESVREGELTTGIESVFLEPADFSGLQN